MSLNSIPGGFQEAPTSQGETIESNHGISDNEANLQRLPAIERLCAKIFQAPFIILYFVITLAFNVMDIFKPFKRMLCFYDRHPSQTVDRITQLNNLMDMLILECQTRNISKSLIDEENTLSERFDFNTLYNLNDGRLRDEIIKGTYTDLLDICTEQCKYGLIYLHDPLLDNSTNYLEEILCTENFINLVNKYQILLWFGDVVTSEGLQIVNAMKIRELPFLAVISLNSNKVMEMKGKLEGNLSKYESDYLETILNKNYNELLQLRQQKQNIALERIIREQQDSRYRESLRRDQRRDQERADAARIANEYRVKSRNWLLWRKSRLRCGDNEDSCRLAIRFEDGVRVVERFKSDCHVEDIYVYVVLREKGLLESEEEFHGDENEFESFVYDYGFRLVTPAPRKELDKNLVLKDEPLLYPSGSVLVESEL
ncbi:hypothetical protein TBLA_0B09480 [Henningerozyma blattae CBS 6284]|uniref:UBX domain-containing protein n=1 Tax=Henningerozyma blattae (strain ATCC 34711 / CBS 6284 / DSM 70876 / NBRC 10599 / NRRL Y-10934 / UCD 77-7) TaxID=1071380 RepID=I2H063_HENB6|nr:hypothetical protein TBLA_0B09480 [Tetrapisispora blattae CBS 6284]CCH59765.1 hypothetical protein TBLA_0B09480 [Tetrapisispora blattae CBS 6284]